jgi:hypothetical protein
MGEAHMTQKSSDAQTIRGKETAISTIPAADVREALPKPEQQPPAAVDEPQPASAGVTPGRGDAETQIEFASFTHQYIRDFIALADQKATFFFTGATALLAFLYSKNVSVRWLKPVMTWHVLDALAFVAMGALAGGAFLSLLVIIPRTPGSRRGFLFWEAIAEYESGRQYADELWLLSPPSLFQVKATHCFALAKVCRRKYRMLRYALWTGAVGLAAALGVFLFL